jgi:uncharacterized protein
MLPCVEALRLLDHHCHGVLRRDLDRDGLEGLLTEAGPAGAGRPGESMFDSRVGFALRRWCPPVLGLPAHTTPEEYLARRSGLGPAEVTRRFLGRAGLGGLCVDTGFEPEPLLTPAELGAAAGAPAHPVLRLERLAEQILGERGSAAGFADQLRDRLSAAAGGGVAGGAAAGGGVVGGGVVGGGVAGGTPAGGAVAVKSIAAYRVGLELDGTRPSAAEVAAAAGRYLAAGPPVRVADEVLHRFLIWTGIDLGLPVQVHAGYGDRDVDLHRCDPLLLTGLLRATEPAGVPVILLHNYPFHRNAGYLAQVFRHVYLDVSLATHGVGRRAGALLAEALELAPFGKLLFASDAYGLPELYYLGALLFRQALSQVLREGLAAGEWTGPDAARLAGMTGAGNARRVYRLPA